MFYEGGSTENPDNFCFDNAILGATGSATITQASPAVVTVPLDLVDGSPVGFATGGGGINAFSGVSNIYFKARPTLNFDGTNTTGNISSTPLEFGITPTNTSAGLTSPQTLMLVCLLRILPPLN